MGKIRINEIKTLTYEGYLWMSDKENPTVYENESVTLPEEDANPFVVEGQLYNEKEGLSYSIKYVDGQYIVQEYEVTETDMKSPDNQVKTYLSNRMGEKKLQFLRYWEEVPDEDNFTDSNNPNGLPVLTQTKNVFIGFKKFKKKEEEL